LGRFFTRLRTGFRGLVVALGLPRRQALCTGFRGFVVARGLLLHQTLRTGFRGLFVALDLRLHQALRTGNRGLSVALGLPCRQALRTGRAERLAKKRDRSDAVYAYRTNEQREEDRLDLNQRSNDSYHRNKLEVVHKPKPTSSSGSQYTGVVCKYEGGPYRWKVRYNLIEVQRRWRRQKELHDNPAGSLQYRGGGGRAWDKLSSSAPGFKNSKLLNLTEEYEAAVAAGAGAVA
jgi:hypothetical protein